MTHTCDLMDACLGSLQQFEQTRPKVDDIFARGLVTQKLTAQQILSEHSRYASDTSKKRFSGTTLGFVTPWNGHGYDVAKVGVNMSWRDSELARDPLPDLLVCGLSIRRPSAASSTSSHQCGLIWGWRKTAKSRCPARTTSIPSG